MNVVTNHDQFQYDLMGAAIQYIQDHADEHPSLDQVAAAIGLSPSHFQRVFSQWVGVSPKNYLQYLTVDHARRLLEDRFTVLDTTLDAGLSSPGRLHDLFVKWEAMSPGEYARKGKGLTIRWDWFDSPFGEMLVMATDRGICGVAFASDTGRDNALADMRGRWPAASYEQDGATLRPWVDAALGGSGEVRLVLAGAPFQIHVWEALLRIPSGHVTTYSEIAKFIGKPRAVRAVGTAVGRNPISWLIPCHRALRRDGALGGYHWGLPVKRAMMAWESARLDAQEAPPDQRFD
ncbi:MAG: bifunctional helix-turn-helix domain-containing protein/methylated-DNA--[protein]-cysteine S-methyltransferase [Pseudomonadota bacterium]